MYRADEDRFKLLDVEIVTEFLGLVFCNALLIHKEGNEVKCNYKKPPPIFCEELHSAETAHDPAWNGCYK